MFFPHILIGFVQFETNLLICKGSKIRIAFNLNIVYMNFEGKQDQPTTGEVF